ncbi:mechanosensitive ion channel domain-containing protein [Pseudomonas sp. NA-150]|uniref:mechanosensitive ion channel domain-containing protein n=1 Tax=Pseudomonas sp. NA-150 TaxID=3367525 RepID=UPI0037CB8183
MESPLFAFPLASAVLFVIIDLTLWQWVDARHLRWKMLVRLVLFALFSASLMDGGLSPLFPVPEGFTPARHTLATLLAIVWWLFGARTLTALAVVILEPRIGGKGHLLQDLMGALFFLIAVVGAAAYILDIPVKGLLATSGAVAIILGLAVQSTLGDVFSGIVLNATKPFRVDDVICVDDIEGKVIEIDWRSTYLLTSAGSMVVIPNAMAAKTRIVNLTRPGHFYAVTLTIELPVRLRPSLVLDSLEKALQGCRELLAKPKGGAVVKNSGLRSVEYEVTGYVKSRDRRGAVRNQLYDLIYRQLAASEPLRQEQLLSKPSSRQSAVLNSVGALRMLNDEARGGLENFMHLKSFAVGTVVLHQGVVPDALMIVESGVMTVAVERPEGWCEVGRMGPGEVMGETGFIDHTPTLARFTAMSECMVYCIARADLDPWLDEHSEIRGALAGLARYRAQARATMLQQYKPADQVQSGFLHWLRRRVSRVEPPQ